MLTRGTVQPGERLAYWTNCPSLFVLSLCLLPLLPPQSVGQLLEVSVDPTNEENMTITFVNRVDAEKVRTVSFQSMCVAGSVHVCGWEC